MITITSKDASPSFTFREFSHGQEEFMSLRGIQRSLDVLTLNRSTLNIGGSAVVAKSLPINYAWLPAKLLSPAP